MLAYDLFLQNKTSPAATNVKRVKPVKKIYYRGDGHAELDEKTPEEYDSEIRNKIQNALSMPLNTSPYLSLPNKVTGANQPRPYIEFYGKMELKKNGDMVFSISRSGKNSKGEGITFDAAYNVSTKQRTISTTSRTKKEAENGSSIALGSGADGIFLSIDKNHYFVEDKNLFQAYVDSGALTADGFLPEAVFSTICNIFFDHVEERWTDDYDTKEKRVDFSLFILPSDSPVNYRDDKEESLDIDQQGQLVRTSSISYSSSSSSSSFQTFEEVDAFGESLHNLPNKPTQTAKFMSYDDPAFTINFAEREKFYQNLFIGLESHEKIGVPADNLVEISGFSWMFVDITDPKQRFQRTGRGIYHQLWYNYGKLREKAGDPYHAKAQMKVVCFKATQAKLEVLINENLSMPELGRLFSGIRTDERIPQGALELLIQRKERKVIWSDYIDAVRGLLGRRRISYHWLLATFTSMIRRELFDFLEKPSTAKDFFLRSEFCIKVLNRTGDRGLTSVMNETENFAYKTGKIAGRYIRFKESNEESSSSLRDILTYSKYDREKLRFVIQRVGLGVNLSKASNVELDKITTFIKNEMPEQEIDDNNSHNDNSYFFYKGVFEELGSGGLHRGVE